MTATVAIVKDISYYEKEETKQDKSKKGRKDKENYYSEDGQVIGRFCGSGSERLGITGEIKKGDFLKFVNGFHPKTNKEFFKHKKTKWDATDITFSAPKDFSMLYFLADDEERKALQEIFNKAVDRGLNKAESVAYRRTDKKNGKSKDCDLFIASFQHETARPLLDRRPDMQIHAHNPVLRRCLNADGQIKVVDNYPLFQNQKLIGSTFRAELANGMRKMGYQIVPHKEKVEDEKGRQYISSWKVKGISDEMREHFSGRGTEINKVAEQKGKRTSIDKYNIAQNIKRQKVIWDRDELINIWRDEAKENFGFTNSSIASLKSSGMDFLLEGAKNEDYLIKTALDKQGRLFEGKLRLRLAEYEQFSGVNADKLFQKLVDEKTIERQSGFLFKVNIDLSNVNHTLYKKNTSRHPNRHISRLVEYRQRVNNRTPKIHLNNKVKQFDVFDLMMRILAASNYKNSKATRIPVARFKETKPILEKGMDAVSVDSPQAAPPSGASLFALRDSLGSLLKSKGEAKTPEQIASIQKQIDELNRKIAQAEVDYYSQFNKELPKITVMRPKI